MRCDVCENGYIRCRECSGEHVMDRLELNILQKWDVPTQSYSSGKHSKQRTGGVDGV